MPHSRYTHRVIELTDGRCYCLACDEVVAEDYLSRRGATVEERPARSEPSGHPSTGI